MQCMAIYYILYMQYDVTVWFVCVQNNKRRLVYYNLDLISVMIMISIICLFVGLFSPQHTV